MCWTFQELGDVHGTVPLHLAALRGHLEVVQTLVLAGRRWVMGCGDERREFFILKRHWKYSDAGSFVRTYAKHSFVMEDHSTFKSCFFFCGISLSQKPSKRRLSTRNLLEVLRRNMLTHTVLLPCIWLP